MEKYLIIVTMAIVVCCLSTVIWDIEQIARLYSFMRKSLTWRLKQTGFLMILIACSAILYAMMRRMFAAPLGSSEIIIVRLTYNIGLSAGSICFVIAFRKLRRMFEGFKKPDTN